MFVDNFELMCEAIETPPTVVLKENGLAPSRLSEWREDPWKMPTQKNLYKLADYFGCSVGDFFEERCKSPEEYNMMARERLLQDQERALELFGLNEDEEEFLRIYRASGLKERHQLMAKVYEFDPE